MISRFEPQQEGGVTPSLPHSLREFQYFWRVDEPPKDGTAFLADVGLPRAVLTSFNETENSFAIASLNVAEYQESPQGNATQDVWFETEFEPKLKAWMPLPEMNKQWVTVDHDPPCDTLTDEQRADINMIVARFIGADAPFINNENVVLTKPAGSVIDIFNDECRTKIYLWMYGEDYCDPFPTAAQCAQSFISYAQAQKEVVKS